MKTNGQPHAETANETPPVTASIAVTDEEKARRAQAAAKRLAAQPAGVWRIWFEETAAQLDLSPATFEAMIKDVLRAQEKEARGAEAEKRREQAKADKAAAKIAAEKKKQKEREFKVVDSLPEAEQEARLQEVARRLGEDPATLTEEYAVASTSTPSSAAIEPWPDAVPTAVILPELIKQTQRFVVMGDDDAIVVSLWAMFSWIHGIAIHSPILAIGSADIDSGKSTLVGVLERVTPRPRNATEITGPGAYRIVDRERPTLFLEEADSVFSRKSDLAHIINASWNCNAKIPRQVHGETHWFSPFCPKVVAGNRLSVPNVPAATVSRFIKIKLWPAKADEAHEPFQYADSAEFAELRRKLTRWASDNAATLAEAKPLMPGFSNRLLANWKLLLAIADLAGGKWPKRAREAAYKIAKQNAEPSLMRRLLAAIYAAFQNRTEITSAELVKLLAADPDDEWCEYKGRGPISPHQLAVLLREVGIRSVPLHPNNSKVMLNGYRKSQFTDVFARWLPSDTHAHTPKKAK